MTEQPRRSAGPVFVRVDRAPDLPDALAAAGVPSGRPVVVLVGGADGMDDRHLAAVHATLRAAVLPVLREHDAVVVDGGTDSGVMRAVGAVRAAAGADFPLVGVAAEGTVAGAGGGGGPDTAEIDRHHTHVVLVPGGSWGDESPWLGEVADVIAAGGPSVTLLVNGGEIAYADTSGSLGRRRPVVVLAGTGRTADAIADARAGRGADARAARIAGSRLTRVVPIDDVAGVRAAVSAALERDRLR